MLQQPTAQQRPHTAQPLAMLKCKTCDSEIPDTLEQCPTCGLHAGCPNVRAAESAEEIQALDERYQEALSAAETNGCLSILKQFEAAIRQASVIINVDLDFLYFFIKSGKNLYASYEQAVEGQARIPAELAHDQARRGTGAIMFGGYARAIRYAALSLDGSGLDSYGPFAIKLREIAIRERATLLENNSYDFVRKHHLAPGAKRPPGYIASWANRHKLAVAKLAGEITPSTTAADFPRLLLTSTGNRATDEFIEVHIFGTFE